MNDFSILQEQILQFGWEAIFRDIDNIKNPILRAIERQNFYEAMKTLPVEFFEPDGIETVLMAEKLIA